jgi:probable phosphoglycerate mutase
VLLARHGETDWNRDGRFQGHADPPLNEPGRAQAAELAERLAADGITALYASDLRRARETASIVADRLDLEVSLHPGLREIDVGEFQSLTRDEIDIRWPAAQARFEELGYGWLDGETLDDLSARVVGAVLEIATRHPGEHVLAVGHGGTIRAALAYADGMDIVAHRKVWPGPAANGAIFEVVAEEGALHRVD